MTLFSCIPCSSSSSSFPKENPIIRDVTATSSSDVSSGNNSSSSSNSSLATTTSSAADDVVSIQTFPSLPTLHSFFPSKNAPAPPISASFSLLSSLNTPQSQTNSHSAPALAIFSNLLFSFSDSSTSVYDLTDLHQTLSLPSLSSAGAVKFAVFSSSNLFTAHQDGKIRIWTNKPPKIRLITSLPTLTDRALRFPLPSNYITIRRHRKRLWIEHADAVSAVAVGSGLLYSVSWDRTLKIWRLSDLRCLESLTAHDDAINAVAVGPDGTVYTGSADRRIKVWAKNNNGSEDRHVLRRRRRRGYVLVATLERHKSAVNALAISGDGHVLYSGACDRSILVWEREESANFVACTGALRGHGKAILCLSTVGMSLVVSGSNDRTVRIWRRGEMGEGYSCLCVMMGHVRGVRTVVAEREEAEGECYRVCSGSLDGEVRVWSVRVEIGKGSDKH